MTSNLLSIILQASSGIFFITYFASRMLIVFSHPKRYQSKITPRSEKAISLIQTIQDEHPLTKGDSETIMSIPTGAWVSVTLVYNSQQHIHHFVNIVSRSITPLKLSFTKCEENYMYVQCLRNARFTNQNNYGGVRRVYPNVYIHIDKEMLSRWGPIIGGAITCKSLRP